MRERATSAGGHLSPGALQRIAGLGSAGAKPRDVQHLAPPRPFQEGAPLPLRAHARRREEVRVGQGMPGHGPGKVVAVIGLAPPTAWEGEIAASQKAPAPPTAAAAPAQPCAAEGPWAGGTWASGVGLGPTAGGSWARRAPG